MKKVKVVSYLEGKIPRIHTNPDKALLKKLNKGDIKGAANEFPRWNKGGGRTLKGLTVRRLIEREVFLR